MRFWARQGLAVTVAVVSFFGLLSIWLDNPARLTTAMRLAKATTGAGATAIERAAADSR